MKKFIFSLFVLPLMAINAWGQAGTEHQKYYDYVGYSLRIKQNSGMAIAGNATSYLNGTEIAAVGLLSSSNPNESRLKDTWNFIPVGGNEPGWYYVKNAYYGTYLSGADGDTVSMKPITDLNAANSPDVKWRLVKTAAYDPNSFPYTNPVQHDDHYGLATHFRLITADGNVLAKSESGLEVVSASEAPSRYAVIEILHEETAHDGRNPGVLNKDMQLISNLKPINITDTEYPDLPDNINDAFNTLNKSGDVTKIYFPIAVGAFDFSKAYLVYNYASLNKESNKTDNGYYFVRLKNRGSMRIAITNETTELSNIYFKISYKSRVAAPSGITLPFVENQDRTLSSVKDIGQLTATSVKKDDIDNDWKPIDADGNWKDADDNSYSSPPTPLGQENYVDKASPENPDGWEARNFIYGNNGQLQSYMRGTIDNLMSESEAEVFVDVKEFDVTLMEAGTEHKRPYDYIGYSMRMKQNSGSVIEGNNVLSYLTGTGTLSAGLLSVPNMTGQEDVWNFIPVGGEEPGWYYIKNASYQNSYLTGTTFTGAVSLTPIADLNNEPRKEVKWRLVRSMAWDKYSFPALEPNSQFRWGLTLHFRLVTQDNKVLAMKDNKLVVLSPADALNNHATVQVMHENSFSGNIPGVRNQDLEIVSNLKPIAINATEYPVLPATAKAFNDLNATGNIDNIYYPISMTANDFSKVHLVYNYASSNVLGNKLDYGYYFIRVKNGGKMFTSIINQASPGVNDVFQVGYFSRVGTKDGKKPTDLPCVQNQNWKTVNCSSVKDVGQITASSVELTYNSSTGFTWTKGYSETDSYSSPPTPLAQPNDNYTNKTEDAENADGWEYRKFNYLNVSGLQQYLLASIDNLMPTTGDEVFIDIDNFSVELVENWNMQYKFKNYILRLFGDPTKFATGNGQAKDFRTESQSAQNTRLYRTNAIATLTDDKQATITADYFWNFVPVGSSEPGWYYIRNQGSGTYVSCTAVNGNTPGLALTALPANANANARDDYKWRLVKIDTYHPAVAPGVSPNDNPAAGRFFQIISKSNKIFAATSNNGKFNNKHVDFQTIKIEANTTASDVLVSLFSVELQDAQSPVFNEDMELVSNYIPIPTQSLDFPTLPASLEEDFSPTDAAGKHADATDYFPVGYARVGDLEDVRLIHDYYSSGNADEFGFYFVRIKNGGRLATTSNFYLPATNKTNFVVSYWSRIATPTGVEPDRSKGLLPTIQSANGSTPVENAKSVGQLTALKRTGADISVIPTTKWNIYSSPATAISQTIFTPIDKDNDPDAWEYMYFNYKNVGTGLGQNLVAAIDNLMPKIGYKERGSSDVFLDIDNLELSTNEYSVDFEFKYKKENQTPQQVHQYAQDIFVQMGNDITLSVAAGDYSYYRWHVGESDFPGLVFKDGETNVDANPKRLGTNAGKFAFDHPKEIQSVLSLYKATPSIEFVTSSSLQASYNTGEVITVTCDVSNYLDYTFTEDTDKDHYLLTEPKLSFRNYFRMTPAWVCAQRINQALEDGKVLEHNKMNAPSGSSLRIMPQYEVENYYLNNTTEGGYTGFTPNTGEAKGISFHWVNATGDTITANPASLGGKTVLSTSRYYTITAPATGTVVYDCYVYNGSIYRKVARFEVTAINAVEAIQKEVLATEGTEGTTDLLAKYEYKRLLAELTFDGAENRYNMGLDPFEVNNSSYGFVDPTYFGNGVGDTPRPEIIDRDNLGHGHQLAPWRYEYGFPKMINEPSDGTTSGTAGYGWQYEGIVWDRTHTNSKGTKTGNMLYVDAGHIPGTVAVMDIPTRFCPGSIIYLSAWIANLASAGSNVSPNLTFLLKDKETGIPVMAFNTGDIATKGEWYQIAAAYAIPEESRDLILEVRNNGSSNADDVFAFALDDICVWGSTTPVTIEKVFAPFCKGTDMQKVEVTIDLKEMKVSEENSKIFYRFAYYDKDNNLKRFAETLGEDVDFYIDKHTDEESDFCYGIINLDGNNETDSRIVYKDFGIENGYLTGFVTFTQEIPGVILDDAGDIPSFVSYGSVSLNTLKNVDCTGEFYFEIPYDEPEFFGTISTISVVLVPLKDLSACTNATVVVSATMKNGEGEILKDIISYDWYYGPLYAKTEDEFKEYVDNYEIYDPNLNLTRGFYDRKIQVINGVVTDTKAIDAMSVGGNIYSLSEDLAAYRHFYPNSTDVLPASDLSTLPANFGSGYGDITSLSELNALLFRIRYYNDFTNDINTLWLSKKVFDLFLYSDAPYFITAIPIADGNAICTNPFETKIKAVIWSSISKYGEVKEDGTQKKNYPDEEINTDYVYTIRLPEKMNGEAINDKFVVPFLYVNEVHKAALDLISVDGTPVNKNLVNEGLQLSGAHFGLIDPEQPNKLLNNHYIWATSKLNEETGEVEKNAYRYMLPTYWSIDGDRGEKHYPESYPLIWNYYNYYNPDPEHPAPDFLHTYEVDGRPYPIGTMLGKDNGLEPEQERQNTITNNKLGLEISAGSLLKLIDNWDLNPDVKLPADGKFKPGSVYEFRFRTTADNAFANEGTSDCDKSYKFIVKVVPETAYWAGAGTDWNDDDNWTAQGDNELKFAPLRSTNVVLLSDKSNYPILEEDKTPPTTKDPYIEYNYNWVPNGCSEIYFGNGSELGNQYLLDFDNAKVELKVNTMQWYNLSAPLRDMYSGDYMFEWANPVTEIRLYNTYNPQTGAFSAEWTKSFNNTNIRLNPGEGYSISVGRVYYEQVTDAGTVGSSVRIADRTWVFPQTKMIFNFYDDVTKKLLPRTEQVPVGGRDYAGRFIYEETMNGDVLVEVPTKQTEGGKSVIVGNPLMSHIDFKEFYRENKDVIEPTFKVLTNGNEFSVYSGVDENGDGEITSYTSIDGLTATSIAPMQSFVVTTKEGYTGNPATLKITKDMSVTAPNYKLRAASKESGALRITTSNANYSSQAVVVVSENAKDGFNIAEDTRKMLIQGVTTSPSVFTVVDNMYLDINRVNTLPESLPIGISTTAKGATKIHISGFSSIESAGTFSFMDTKSGIFAIEDDEFEYSFNNSEGDQIGRFYLLYDAPLSTSAKKNNLSESLQIFVQDKNIHVVSTDGNFIKNVVLCDVMGRILCSRDNTKNSHVVIPATQLQSIVIIKANTLKTTKIIKLSLW